MTLKIESQSVWNVFLWNVHRIVAQDEISVEAVSKYVQLRLDYGSNNAFVAVPCDVNKIDTVECFCQKSKTTKLNSLVWNIYEGDSVFEETSRVEDKILPVALFLGLTSGLVNEDVI